MAVIREAVRLGDREVIFETGEIAQQAGGAVVVTAGDSVLLATATADRETGKFQFLPLTVEYRKRMAAAGRIPGGYLRRDGAATELDTLSSRLVDRSLRPLIHEGWRSDTQVIVDPLSFDPATDLDALAISAASAALQLSPVPFAGPVVGCRVGERDGRLVAFAPPEVTAAGALDLLVAASREGLVMIEGGGREVAEATVLEAFRLAAEAAGPVLDALARLAERAGRPKAGVAAQARDPALAARVAALAEAPLRAALALEDKVARAAGLARAFAEVESALPEVDDEVVERLVEEAKERLLRADTLDGKRVGGRGPADIRAISGRAGWLPRCHGSSLFTRGETQAIVTCTLGSDRDAQSIETLDGQVSQRFLLHYQFPPYSTGEVKPLRGPGRREVGHGHLARRALLPVIPDGKDAPGTVRLESLVTSSNGSSSMATVCGGTLALFDAGVALARPVAGIAMGLVKEGERHVVLSDILGDEDHLGDMDFKVAGTERGITAIQLDNKLGAVPPAIMEGALAQAREGRLHILERMAEILAAPRAERSAHAPRVEVVAIEPARARDLIGPGGRNVKGVEALGVRVDIDQAAGEVRLHGTDAEALVEARRRVEELTAIPRLGQSYPARVVTRKPFGCFVRLFEGIEGLVPDPSLAEGATVDVEVTGVNGQGKLELRRATASASA